jgi:hypothetical protein
MRYDAILGQHNGPGGQREASGDGERRKTKLLVRHGAIVLHEAPVNVNACPFSGHRATLNDMSLLARRAVWALLFAAASAGCGSDAKLHFEAMQLGRTLNPDGTVGNNTTTFRTKDTIYVSVLTANAGAGTVGARWTFSGRLVGEPSKPVRYKGASATEFHLANSSGFPLGEYRVEAFIDGERVGERAFRVEQ